MVMRKGPSMSRYYDDAIPAPLLAQIKERRRSPTGLMHQVKVGYRGEEEILRYPFKHMELGDFFIVSTIGRSEKSMRTVFRQAAARYDYELFISPWKMPHDPNGLRVCLTIINVNQYKLKWAADNNTEVQISNGRWKNTRKMRAKHRRERQGSWVTIPRAKPAFTSDKEPPLPPGLRVGENVTFAPDVPVDPDEIRRRALAMLNDD